MDLPSYKITIEQERNFTLRRAVERLREGIFDPFAVQVLTAREDKLVRAFDQGLSSPMADFSPHLCICGDYGQGKSHPLKAGGQYGFGFSGTGPGLKDQVFSLKDGFNGPNLKGKERRKGPVKGAKGVG